MKNSMNKFNNLMAKMIGFVALIFAFMFVGMVNSSEISYAASACNNTAHHNKHRVSFSGYTETSSYIKVSYQFEKCRNQKGAWQWWNATLGTVKFYYELGTYGGSGESGASPTITGLAKGGDIYFYRSTNSQMSAGGVTMDGICGRFKEWYDTRGYGGSFSIHIHIYYSEDMTSGSHWTTKTYNSQYFYPITLTGTPTSTSWAYSQTVSFSASTVNTISRIYTYDSFGWPSHYSWSFDASSASLTIDGTSYSMTIYCTAATCSKRTTDESGSHYITAVAIDNKGNAAIKSVTAKVDRTQPTYTFYASSGGSYQKSTSIGARMASLSDTYSGINWNYEYMCLDTSSSLTGDDLYSENCDYVSYNVGTSSMGYFDSSVATGTYYLYVFAQDNAGNYTWSKATGTYYVDNTAPSFSSATASSTTYVREKTVTIKYRDDHSKVKSIKYCWANNTSCTPNTTATATVSGNYGEITLTKNSVTGIYYIYFYAIDNAGNQASSTGNRYYYFDNDAPDFSSASPASDTTYTKSKTVTITYHDKYSDVVRSGVKEILYCWTTSSSGCTPNLTLSSTGSVSITKSDETGIYYLSVYGVDNATNYSGVTTKGPYYFDNTDPKYDTWYATHGVSASDYWYKAAIVGEQMNNIRDDHSGVNYSNSFFCLDTSNSLTEAELKNKNCDYVKSIVNNTYVYFGDASVVTGTYYMYMYLVDNAGNDRYGNADYPIKIDHTAPKKTPTYSATSSTTWKKSYDITVTYVDDHSGVGAIEYCWNTNSTASSVSSCDSTSKSISGKTGKYYLHTRARDKSKNDYNYSDWVVTGQFYLDNEAPSWSSFSPNGSTTWVKSREVTITYSDNSKSGVNYIYYCWAESTTSSTAASCTPGSKSESTGSLKITKNTGSGYWWLTVKAEDALGNTSVTKTSSVFYFDNDNPGNPSYTAEDTTWRQSKVVTFTSEDIYDTLGETLSGVERFYYCTYFSGESACTPTTSSSYITASSGTATLTLTLTISGKRYIRSFAVDNAGNTSSITTSGVYWIDSDAPYLSGDKIYPDGNSTYAKSQSVTVTYGDDHSGVDTIEYCWNTSSTANSVSSCTSSSNSISGVTGNYYLHVRAYDKSTSANYSEWSVSNVFKLDNTDPEFVSRSPDGEDEYTKSKSVVVTYTDGHSGVAIIKYCWTTSSSGCTPASSLNATDGAVTINRATGSGTYYLSTLAIDAVGNDSSATTSTTKYKFDNTAPTISSYNPVNNTTYKKSQSVKITYSDAHINSIGTIEYCWTTSSSLTSCSSPSTVSNGGTVTRNSGTGVYYIVSRARDTALKGDGGATSNYNWSGWTNSASYEGNTTGDGYYLDNTAPTWSGFYTIGGGTWKRSVNIGARIQEVTDAHSGLSSWVYMCLDQSDSLTGEDLYYLDCEYIEYDVGTSTTLGYFDSNIETGIYYLYVYAEDNAGNYKWAKSSNTYYVDNTKPSFELFSPDGNSGWQKQITADVTFGDEHSGVASIYYCWAKGTSTTTKATCSPGTEVTTEGTISVPSDTIAGIYYLNVKAKDKAGNVSVVTTSNAYKLAVSQELKSDGTHVEYYHSIQLGLDGITAGNTLKVLLDSSSTLEGDKCLTNTKNITLNMNGKKMTCSIASTPGLTNSGTLTINGGGTIESSYYGISNSGNLTVTDTTVKGTQGIYSTNVLTVNSGTITGNGSSNGDGIHSASTSANALVVNDGTITGTDDGVQNGSTGTVIIKGGSITGVAGIWNNSGGTLKVEGGTIKGTSSSYGGIYNGKTLEITGGTITGTYGVKNASGTATISGGTISSLTNEATVTISGTAKISGAASNSSSLTMSDGETGAMTSSGTTTLNGGTVASLEITDGTSTVNGATVSGTLKLSAEKVFNFYSGTIGALTSSGTVTMTGGTISGDTITNGSMTMSGGTASEISNGGGLTIKGSASTGKITNLCVLVVEAGTVAGILNKENGVVANVNGELTMTGGTVSVTSGIAIEVTAGTVSISGGTVSGSTGISTTAGTVTVSGGTITGTSSYAINATGGTVNYTGGTLKGNTTNIYTYYMKSGVSFSIGDRSEYTYISGSQYITTLVTEVATIGSTKYNTLQAALNVGGTITLNKNVTDLSLTVASGKSVTLNLNGKTLNSFITARVQTTEGTTTFITNNGTLTVYNGTIELYREGIVIHNKGTLNYGLSGQTGASLIAEEGYAIKNNAGNILNYVNGTLTSGDEHTIIDSQNKDLYIVDGHYMDFSATAPYFVELKEDTILGDSMTASSILDDDTLIVTVNHEREIVANEESVKVWLRIGGTVGEYAMSCQVNASNKKQTVCTTQVTDEFAYLYNAIYENELVIVYIDYDGSYISAKEIQRRDLLIIPEFLSGGLASEEVTVDYDGGSYTIISDGAAMLVLLNGVDSSEINVESAVVMDILFGKQRTRIFSQAKVGIVIEEGDPSESCSDPDNGCVWFDKAKIVMKPDTRYNSNYRAADVYILDDFNSNVIQVYNFKPKLSASSVTALSATTCELGSACSITPLSYYDYHGNPVGTVSNVITHNGEVVNSIDTRKLGTYLVTTVAEDNYGNKSKAIVREYKVVDTTSPVVEVSKEALVVKQGEELNDLDEIVVNDNYDKVLMIERIIEEVDTNKVGTYRLGYRVVDSSGNITIVYRDVIVMGNHTNIIILGVIISCLISIAVGVGTYHYIKRKKSYLN